MMDNEKIVGRQGPGGLCEQRPAAFKLPHGRTLPCITAHNFTSNCLHMHPPAAFKLWVHTAQCTGDTLWTWCVNGAGEVVSAGVHQCSQWLCGGVGVGMHTGMVMAMSDWRAC